MIKPSDVSKMLNPVYVLIVGVLGGSIPFVMYMWNFPVSTQPSCGTWRIPSGTRRQHGLDQARRHNHRRGRQSMPTPFRCIRSCGNYYSRR